MGYTHYWKLLSVPKKEQIAKVLAEAAVVRENLNIPLQLRDDDTSLPLFS